MNADAVVRARVDSETKEEAAKALGSIRLCPSAIGTTSCRANGPIIAIAMSGPIWC